MTDQDPKKWSFRQLDRRSLLIGTAAGTAAAPVESVDEATVDKTLAIRAPYAAGRAS